MPKHLAEADLPGTYGFDPLRLGTNPEQLKWCVARTAVAAMPSHRDPSHLLCAAQEHHAQSAAASGRACAAHYELICEFHVYDWRRILWHHRYAEAEKTNGRWAMAACAGILFTDAVGLPNWVTAGADVSTICPPSTRCASRPAAPSAEAPAPDAPVNTRRPSICLHGSRPTT